VESPSLETFKPRLDAVQPALGDPAPAGSWLGDPQRSLPTPAMLGCWDSVCVPHASALTGRYVSGTVGLCRGGCCAGVAAYGVVPAGRVALGRVCCMHRVCSGVCCTRGACYGLHYSRGAHQTAAGAPCCPRTGGLSPAVCRCPVRGSPRVS